MLGTALNPAVGFRSVVGDVLIEERVGPVLAAWGEEVAALLPPDLRVSENAADLGLFLGQRIRDQQQSGESGDCKSVPGNKPYSLVAK